jgi:hypothetical protein
LAELKDAEGKMQPGNKQNTQKTLGNEVFSQKNIEKTRWLLV